MRPVLLVLPALLLTALPAVAEPQEEPLRVQRTAVVSGSSAYGACARPHRQGLEASPALLAGRNPLEPDVVWQQDASRGGGADIATSAAGLRSTAGDLGVGLCGADRAPGTVTSAPSVAVGPDGTQWSAAAVNGPQRDAVVVARRTPGAKWVALPVSVETMAGPGYEYLPPTIAVDPQDPDVVHVAYSRNHFPAGTLAVHRSSTDGGGTWSAEHRIDVGPTPFGYDFAEQLVALGGPDLLALSTEVDQAGLPALLPDYLSRGDLTQAPIVVRARRSTDGGVSWSLPQTVLTLANGGVRDRSRPAQGSGTGIDDDGDTALRSLVRPSVAVAPDGAVHVAAESVAQDGDSTQVLVARLPKGSATWTTVRPGTVPGVAFAASVAVDGDGRLAVSYLAQSGTGTAEALPAQWQVAVLRPDGTWGAQPLGATFDLRRLASSYVGDQGALLGLRHGFAAATVVGTGDPEDPSDVVLTTLR